jgi:methyl-accepting chemotaxis protein
LNVLEWMRNVLVVAPILFTWYALRVVSENYTVAIQSNPNLRFDTFLVLGETVYSGPLANSTSFTLTSIAAIDFTILLVIFITTLFVNLGHDLVENVKRRGALSLRTRLEALLWQVPLSAPAGAATIDNSQLLNASMALLNQQKTANDIVTNLQAQTSRLNTAVSGLETAAASLQANMQSIQTGIEQASRGIADASVRLDQSAQATQTTTQSALTDLRASMAQLNTALGAMQSISPLTQAISQSAQAQTNIADKVESAAQAIADNQQHLDDMQGKFNQQLVNAQGLLSQVAKDLKASAQRIGQSGRSTSLPLTLLAIFSFIQLILLGVIAIAYLTP